MINEDIQRDYPEICAKFYELVRSDKTVHRRMRYLFKSNEMGLSLKTIVKTLRLCGYRLEIVKEGEKEVKSLLDLGK